MKIWIALGAFAIGTAAIAFRPAPAPSRLIEPRAETLGRTEDPVEAPAIARPEAPIVVEQVRPEPAPVQKVVRSEIHQVEVPPVLSLAQEKMLFLFERELSLSPEQRRYMVQVLGRREQEIAEVQKGVLTSGILRTREYDLRVREIQAVSYAKMAEILDQTQRLRWDRLMAEGRLGDAISFEVPQSVVLLQE